MEIQLGDIVLLSHQASWSLHVVLEEMPKERKSNPSKFRLNPLGKADRDMEHIYFEDELSVVGGIRFFPEGLYILTRDYSADGVYVPGGTIFSIDTGRVEPLMVCSPTLLPRKGLHYSFVADRMVPALETVLTHFVK